MRRLIVFSLFAVILAAPLPAGAQSSVADFYRGKNVTLIVGYSAEDVGSPEEAAHYAMKLTEDAASDGTHWYVFDRQTKEGRFFEQSDFEDLEDDYVH